MKGPAATWRMDRLLPPSPAAAEALCADVRRRLKETAGASDCFGVELLLREALANAVVHGSRGRPGARIRCEVRYRGRSVRIAVTDSGPGFDWKKRQSAPPSGTRTSGRGLCLYAAYADGVNFNESGNRVVLVKRLGRAGQGDAQ